MTACRAVISDAMRALKAIAPGDDPQADELTVALEALQNVVLELHNARGPLRDVDVTAATWIANENQRVRVQLGDTATITLPNSIPIWGRYDPYDYGFQPGCYPYDWPYIQGSTAAADGVQYRQPRDGARIEIVGTTQALYFYRADLNAWMSATGLALDTEMPLNARYAGAIGALLAERLMEVLALGEPTPGLAARISMARSTLYTQAGTRRSPVRAEYF